MSGQNAVFQSDHFKMENSSFQTKDLRINGDKISAMNQYLSFNEATGTVNSNGVHANDLKVKGNDVIVSSPDLFFDPAARTVTVKSNKLLETIE